MKLNKGLLIFPYLIIIIISISFLVNMWYPVLLYLLYFLIYPPSIGIAHELFKILVYISKNLLIGFILSMAMICIIKYHLPRRNKIKDTAKRKHFGLDLRDVPPINPNVINSTDTWVCKKCDERNPNVLSSCKGCGAYK